MAEGLEGDDDEKDQLAEKSANRKVRIVGVNEKQQRVELGRRLFREEKAKIFILIHHSLERGREEMKTRKRVQTRDIFH